MATRVTVNSGKKGFTLIEVMVAIVILAVGLLGLLYAVTITMDTNITNFIRDEAIKIAEQRMDGVLVAQDNTSYEGLKNIPFNTLAADAQPFQVRRDFRDFGLGMTYNVQGTVEQSSIDTRNLVVTVTWSYKGRNYQHVISSTISRGVT